MENKGFDKKQAIETAIFYAKENPGISPVIVGTMFGVTKEEMDTHEISNLFGRLFGNGFYSDFSNHIE